MRKNAFTLIELLAVIVILAIIALIATPIILNIINDSKRESTKISAENYLKTVELALSKELMDNPTITLDGDFTIEDNKIKSIDTGKEISIKIKGDALSSGTLTIEKGKVVKMRKAMINNWEVKLESGKISLSVPIKVSKLVTGQEFCTKIKTLANGTYTRFWASDYEIKSIEFLSNGKLPNGYTKEELISLQNVDVSVEGEKGSIIVYYNKGEIYVYSDNLISFNQDSSQMFNQLKLLEKINLENIDTSDVTDMQSMFNGCSVLTSLNLTSFDTSQVTNMCSMFNSCSSLTSLNLSSFDTQNVTNMDTMFCGCGALTSLDLKKFNTKKVTGMYMIFFDTTNLKPIYVGENWRTSSTNGEMFLNSKTENEEQLCKPNSTHSWCTVLIN